MYGRGLKFKTSTALVWDKPCDSKAFMDNKPDRLVPLLLALTALLAGTISLEVVARGRAGNAAVIVVDQDVSAVRQDLSVEHSAPINDDHTRARLAASRGNRKEAIALYQSVIEAAPEQQAPYAELGQLWLAQGDDEQAIQMLTRAIEIGPRRPTIALLLGRALSHSGEQTRAEETYRGILAAQPDHGSALLALGNLLRKDGRLPEAEQLLRKAASSGGNEHRARALVALGRVQLAAGEEQPAAASFEQAVNMAPASIPVRLQAAEGYLESGDSAQLQHALDILAVATTIAPDLPRVHNALGQAYEKAHRSEEAAAAYKRVLQLDPHFHRARRRLVRLALKQEDFQQARLETKQLISADASNPEHHFLAALVAARAGQYQDAKNSYQSAIEAAAGKYPEAYFNLGLLERREGHLDEAIAAYKTAIDQRPNYRQAHNNLGVTYMAKKQLDKAEESFRRAIAVSDGYAVAWRHLGDAL
ncbi:MAG TPA: tetratricopeptide repeat protein, partial [Sorangium sp.]|nr:tetratricopeptide repeat protein [Sorangium sp.]